MNKAENENTKIKSSKTTLKPSELIFRILTGIILFIFLIVCSYAIYINIKIQGYKKYDLSELNKLDFVFQTYDFDKYLVFDKNQKRIVSEYTDEMNVYYVKGSAAISFKNADARLKPAWDLCDYDEGILRLRYISKNLKECPFDINLKILPEDIFFVTGIQSDEIKMSLTDIVIESENSEEVIKRAKEEIEDEYKNEILEAFMKDNKKDLCLEDDTFCAFLNSLTEMIVSKPDSKWKNVEIVFE